LILLVLACIILNASGLRIEGTLYGDQIMPQFAQGGGNYSIYFLFDSSIDPNNMTFELHTSRLGWIGFGVNVNPGTMVGSDTSIGWVFDNNGTIYFNDHYNGARCTCVPGDPSGGVCPDYLIGGTQNSFLIDAFQDSTGTTVRFVRRIAAIDPVIDTPIVLFPGYLNNVVTAHAYYDVLNQHIPDAGAYPTILLDMNPFKLDFTTFAGNGTGGGVQSGGDNDSKDKIKAHGAMMFVGWMVIIPIGIFFAAFGKRLGMLWFRIHVFVQSLGIVIISCAFITIIERQAQFIAASRPSTHFRVVHGRFGLGIFIICIIQPFLGALADALFNPERKYPGIPDIIHRAFGYGLFILAIANIYLGFQRFTANVGYEVGDTVYALYSLWFGFVIVIYAAFTILKYVLPENINYFNGHKKENSTEMK